MLNINFVPDDYIQTNESRRTNFLYLILLVIVMAGLCGVFVTIKVRQRALGSKEQIVDARMAKAQEQIKQFEELQQKREEMMKTALTTAALIEPVPRSVLLACLTNNLPPGVSLLKLNLVQKEPIGLRHTEKRNINKYQVAKDSKKAEGKETVSKEQLLETYIDIEGIAPSDFEVAFYIEHLSKSKLMDNVVLVESKEYKSKPGRQSQQDELVLSLRQFTLTAMVAKGIHLSEEDIAKIRTVYEKSEYRF